jgi:hypothetical protein
MHDGHGYDAGSTNVLKPLLLIGGIGLVGYLFLRSRDAKAAALGAGGAGEDRVRYVDKDTATPSAFAAKYGGSAARWKELDKVNPDLFLVDVPGPCRDGNPGCYVSREKRADGEPAYVLPSTAAPTVAPWVLGQRVVLPDGWPG